MSNLNSSKLLDEESDTLRDIVTMIISTLLYSLIFIIGITGNTLVVYVVCRKKSMQSVTNLFIMNLALSDILMCMLAVTFTPISFFQEYWIFGKFLCHLISFTMGVSVYVSTLTSLAIALDRYFVIVHPFKPRMKLSVCMFLIGMVWVVSISVSLPLAIYIELQPTVINGTDTGNVKCQESWPSSTSRRFHNLASLFLQYIIPFAVITYSYAKIWNILSNRKRPGKSKIKEQLELKRKKKTNMMLIAMVFIFAICWMPLNIVHFSMEFDHRFTKNENFITLFLIAHVIAMSSTIYNPFLYAWLNDNFRKEFRELIPCIFSVPRLIPKKPKSTSIDLKVLTDVNIDVMYNKHENSDTVNLDGIYQVSTDNKEINNKIIQTSLLLSNDITNFDEDIESIDRHFE